MSEIYTWKTFLACPKGLWFKGDQEALLREFRPEIIEIFERERALWLSARFSYKNGDFFFPILDLDCESAPHRALQAALALERALRPSLGEGKIILSGLKGAKLVFSRTFPIYQINKVKKQIKRIFLTISKETRKNVKLELKFDETQPIRLLGYRSKYQEANREDKFVYARVVSFGAAKKIKSVRDYKRIVSRRPPYSHIQDFLGWLLPRLQESAIIANPKLTENRRESSFEKYKKDLTFNKLFSASSLVILNKLGEPKKIKKFGDRIIHIYDTCIFCGKRGLKAHFDLKTGKYHCKSVSCPAHRGVPLKDLEKTGPDQEWESWSGPVPLVAEDINKLRAETAKKIQIWTSEGGNLAVMTGPGAGKTTYAAQAAQDRIKRDETGVFCTPRRTLMNETSSKLRIDPLPRKEDVCLCPSLLRKLREKGYSDQVICGKLCRHHVSVAHKNREKPCPFWTEVVKKLKQGLVICHYNVLKAVEKIARCENIKLNFIIIDEFHKLFQTSSFSLKILREKLGDLPYESADKLRKLLFRIEQEKPRSTKIGYFIPIDAPELKELVDLTTEVVKDFLFEHLPFDSFSLIEQGIFNNDPEKIEEILIRDKKNIDNLPDLNLLKLLLNIVIVKKEGLLVLTKRKTEFTFRKKVELIDSDKCNILALSASARPEEVKALLGENFETFWAFARPKGEILHINSSFSKRNLECNKNNKRIDLVKKLAKAWTGRNDDKVISYKNAELGDIHYFAAEGTNQLEHEDSLILLGNPVLSPETLLSQAHLLFDNEEEAKNWIIWQSCTELLQSLGRLRQLWTNPNARATIIGHFPKPFGQVGIFPALRLWLPSSEQILEILVKSLRKLRQISQKELFSLSLELANRLKNIDLDLLLERLNGSSLPERFLLLIWKEALDKLNRKQRDKLLLQLEKLNKALVFIHKRKKYRLLLFNHNDAIQIIEDLKQEHKQEEHITIQLPNPPPEVSLV